jgi:UDP-glucose 4-epimerase
VLRLSPAASHTTLVLLEHGHSVVMLDNLSNSFERVFEHMKKIAGDKADDMKFVQVGSSSSSSSSLEIAAAV